MSRMLEALKQIETGSPPPRQGILPVSPEELELFGLRAHADAPTEEPVQTDEPGEENAEVEQAADADHAAAPPAETPGPQQVAGAVESAETGSDVAHLPGPPVEAQHPQYQDLAANILAQLPSGHTAALVFTSPAGGEGKTGTLVPLAAALADRMTGQIIAVDGNFHRPGLADRFGVASGHGLAAVLAGMADWREVVRKTGVERLSVLPGERLPAADDRAPDSTALARVLDQLRSHYRLVLVDTASLGHGASAPMIRRCDGTYLVLRLGRTGRREARRAIRAVEACGGRVLGCVLTGAPVEG